MKLNSTKKVRKRLVNGKENVSVICSKESINFVVGDPGASRRM